MGETRASSTRDPHVIKAMTPQEVVEEFRGLVGSIVNKIYRKLRLRVDFEDVEAYGFQGLLDAHERFDPDQANRFSSYAYYRIRGAILDGCRKQGWLTRDRDLEARKLSAINEYMESTAETRASAPPASSFSEAVQRVSDAVSDAATIFLIQEQDLQDLDQVQPNQHRRLESMTNTVLVREAMKLLDDDERDVIVRFHFENERMADIGESMGYSKSWVSRVNTRALEKMRDYIIKNQ